MNAINLDDILRVLGDDAIRVIGSVERLITHPAPISSAENDTAITFCTARNTTAIAAITATKAGAVICFNEEKLDQLGRTGKSLIMVKNPRLSFIRVVRALFTLPMTRPGIHPTALVEDGAKIHPSAHIGPFTHIAEDCVIGKGTIIHGHVHIYPKTRIGANVVIDAGVVIGADGFGYERNEKDEFEQFPHLGGVVIEDDVDIGANTCIDRGSLGDTIIHQGVKIDNLVHISHNVVIGRHSIVIAHAMVGGSVRIGEYSWIAPSGCLRNKISVGNRSMVGLGAVVVKDVPDNTTVMGVPARPMEDYKKMLEAEKRTAGVK